MVSMGEGTSWEHVCCVTVELWSIIAGGIWPKARGTFVLEAVVGWPVWEEDGLGL